MHEGKVGGHAPRAGRQKEEDEENKDIPTQARPLAVPCCCTSSPEGREMARKCEAESAHAVDPETVAEGEVREPQSVAAPPSTNLSGSKQITDEVKAACSVRSGNCGGRSSARPSPSESSMELAHKRDNKRLMRTRHRRRCRQRHPHYLACWRRN